MSTSAELRIQSQLDTPHEWILSGKMFRIKSWEIEKDEIDRLCSQIIKGEYKLNQIHGKDGTLKGITLLHVSDPEDVERVRTTLMITESGTELRKTSQLTNAAIETRTIKTTAPIWVTKKKLLSVFSKYNSDKTNRTIKVDGRDIEGIQYPIIRFYPTEVIRDGSKTKVNVAYVEFSPLEKYKYDSLVALSMEHRCSFFNNISGEEAILIFDRWTVEKDPLKDKKKLKESAVAGPDELSKLKLKLKSHE